MNIDPKRLEFLIETNPDLDPEEIAYLLEAIMMDEEADGKTPYSDFVGGSGDTIDQIIRDVTSKLNRRENLGK